MRMLLLLCSLLALWGCRRSPPPKAVPPAAFAPSPPPASGNRIVYRFTDHAGEAAVQGSLETAWRGLTYPAKLISPYSHLEGPAQFRVIELALADAEVATYKRNEQPSLPHRLLRFDPVW